MKSKFIRVLTFVLCLAMLLTSMSVFTVTAAGTAEMDITAIFDNGLSYTVPASKYSGDSWRFFYYASVGFDSSLTDKEFKSFTVTWDNGGATGSSEVQMYPQGVASVLYTVIWGVPAPSALVDGATFKIAAGTATNSDTGTTMQLNNDVTMKWNANTQAWEFVPTANYQAGILAVSGNGGGASHIYTLSNDSVPYNGSWAYRYYPYGSYGTMEFIHNGVATPISDGYFQKFSAADYYFNLGSTSASVGDQVRLSGVFACHDFTKQGQGGFYPYIFADIRPITYTYTGSTWTYEVEAVYDQLAFNGFAWSPNVPGADWWDLYLKVDGTIPGEANVTNFANTLTLSVKNSSGVTVLDHATPVLLSYQGHEGGTLLFRLPVSALPAASVDVGSLFTLHAGKANSTTVGVNGIEITKDYTIEYTGSGFANYVDYNYTDLSILNFINRAGNGIYFATDNDYPGNWNKYVGLQISLNGGEKIDKYVGNAGPGSKQMVIDLTEAEWETVTAGSTLTIYAGEAKSIDGADYDGDDVADAIRLTKDAQFKYNGTTWEVYDPNAKVYNELTLGEPHPNDADMFLTEGTSVVPGSWDYNYAGLTVTLNGNPVTNFDFKKPGNDVYFKLKDVTLNAGDVVVISGQSDCTNDATQAGIKLTAPATYYWDGETWVTELDLTVYETITFNGSNFGWFADKNWWDCYFFSNETIPGTSVLESETKFNGLTIMIDGVAHELPLKRTGDNTVNIFTNVNVTTPAVGATFVIKAGKAKSNDGSNGIQLLEDAVFVWNGEKIVPEDQYVAYLDVQTAISGMDGATNKGADAWQFYLDVTTALPGNAWDEAGGVAEKYAINITIDGVLHEGIEAKNAGGNGLYFTIPFSMLPASGEHTLTVNAASYASNKYDHGFTLTSDYTLYINENAISSVKFIKNEASAKPTLTVQPSNASNSANGFCVTVMPEDGAHVGGWGNDASRAYFASDAQTILLVQSGIWVNGSFINNQAIMKRLDASTYYVGLIDIGYTAVAGDEVTVKGLFYDINGHIVEFVESTFTYDGSAWSQYVDRSDYTEYNGKFFIGKPDNEGGNGAQTATTNPNHLYLKGSDGLNGLFEGFYPDHEWNNAYLEAGNGANNGVFLNGNKIAVRFQQYSYSKQFYFMEGHNAKTGDKLTIKGQFYNDAAKVIINITECVFEYNGTKWVDVMTSTVEKDVNADSEVNALDVVWMTRYLADPAIGISNKGDINGDGVVNATDLRILRRYVLGINIVVVNGVAQGTPYYAGGETTKIAYVAPVLGSFDSETKTLTFKSDEEIDRLMDEYAAVGFTHIVTEKAAYLYDESADYIGQQLLYRYYEEAAERGMKVIVVSGYMEYLRTYEGDLSGIVYSNGNTWKNIVDDIIYNQSKYEAFAGFMLGDEPTDAQEKNYIEITEYVRENHPDVLVWYAAFPNYVSSTGVADYADYVKTHGVANGHFMYDNYALRTKTSWFGSSTDYYLETYWFTNLLTVAELGRDYGFTTGVTMQSVALQESGGGLFQNSYQTRPIKKKEDIGFQVYTALAYGMKELDFFTYMNHWSDEMVDDTAMIKTNGKPNDSYFYVKDVYSNIKAMEAALLNFKWLGTIEKNLKTGSNNSSLTNSTYKWSNNSRLAADPSISGAAVVGCLKDEIDGFDGFMIANAQEPYSGGNSTVTLKFKNASKAMVYAADGSVSIVNLTNNQYSVTLAAGTGCFVIPMV